MPDVTPIWSNFDRDALRRVCLADEHTFGDAYGMDMVKIDQPGPEDYYFYRDNGSSILAVAHLDTVVMPDQRRVAYYDTEDGLVIQSGSLDDRLGAYIILEMLPRLGINVDVLLTVGEESGASTAAGFLTDKDYHWMIEFDRGGTDVVTYEYEDDSTVLAVESVGARHAQGIFSDISYMEHLGIKGFNWGVGYHDYHSANGYAYLDDTFEMLALFVDFHTLYGDVPMPHTPMTRRERRQRSWWGDSWIGGGYAAGSDEEMWADESIDPMWDDDGKPIFYDDDGPECYDEDGYYIGPPDPVGPDDVVEYPTPEQLRWAAAWLND